MVTYAQLLKTFVTKAKSSSVNKVTQVEDAADYLIVAIGCDILKCILGWISTEVDDRLSFDTQATVKKARTLI